MPGNHTFFSGSTFLQPVADSLNIGLDQVNFIACQTISLPFSLIFYHWLAAKDVSRIVRMVFHVIAGISICFFCFGVAMKHMICDALIIYAILRWAPSRYSHWLVFVTAMGYLSWIQLCRAFFLPVYKVNITGPMMVLTKKMTSLAFSVHDGKTTTDELSNSQRRDRVERVPNLLEYLSYVFAYQGILCGPFCFYSDFVEFIDGKHVKIDQGNNGDVKCESEPTPWVAVGQKLQISIFFLALNAFVSPRIWSAVFDPDRGFFNLVGYLYVFLFLYRTQYYYAWIMTDCVYNASGFGFNGFTADGQSRWDLVSNARIWQTEMATSWKECLDGWNCVTVLWLRRVVYDRTPAQYQIMATYLASAVWHGFFPGYYLTFATGALFTNTARVVRRHVRPYFLNSEATKLFYDCLTSTACKLALLYCTCPFPILHLMPALELYGRLYFFMHLTSLLLYFGVPMVITKKPVEKEKEKEE